MHFNYTSKLYLKNISKICIGVTARLSSRNLFDHFVTSRETYFTKQVAVTHRNTVISLLIYLEFAFAPVCIVSTGKLFVHKGNMASVSELQFSCNHNYVATILKIDCKTFQNLFNLSLEYK